MAECVMIIEQIIALLDVMVNMNHKKTLLEKVFMHFEEKVY